MTRTLQAPLEGFPILSRLPLNQACQLVVSLLQLIPTPRYPDLIRKRAPPNKACQQAVLPLPPILTPRQPDLIHKRAPLNEVCQPAELLLPPFLIPKRLKVSWSRITAKLDPCLSCPKIPTNCSVHKPPRVNQMISLMAVMLRLEPVLSEQVPLLPRLLMNLRITTPSPHTHT